MAVEIVAVVAEIEKHAVLLGVVEIVELLRVSWLLMMSLMRNLKTVSGLAVVDAELVVAVVDFLFQSTLMPQTRMTFELER